MTHVAGACVLCKAQAWVFSGPIVCPGCRPKFDALSRFAIAFETVIRDGNLTVPEHGYLRQLATHERLHWAEALAFVAPMAVDFMQRTLTFIASDGIITDEERAYFHGLAAALGLAEHPGVVRMGERIEVLRQVSEIRKGKLPTVKPDGLRLSSEEICHLDMSGSRRRAKDDNKSRRDGRLLATNRKLYWITTEGGAEVPWSSILGVQRDGHGLHLLATKKSGAGYYVLREPDMAEAVLDVALRIDKREILVSSTNTRHIPQEVKTRVWQRDQGTCVQCPAKDYLEFDHIIPFAKGGASSFDNVQLLCRRCNLKKSDRI